MNNQINELIDGKALIASALTDRGYPTQPTDSSASMAQKIENMSYDAGWLAQLGYSEQNDGGVKDAVAYSKAIKDGWNPSETTRKFQDDKRLIFFPVVDTSQFTLMGSMFKSSTVVFIPKINTENVTSFADCFMGCSTCLYVGEVSFKSHNSSTNYHLIPATGIFIKIKDIGTPSATTSLRLSAANWGNYSETNRQSLVDTLLTYSFDRATAGYSYCTITLHADTLARLTSAEIAAISAKGYSLAS